jgi:hypothetical protein
VDAVEVRSIRNSNQFQIIRRKDFPFRVLHFHSGEFSEKEQRYMRFEKPISGVTSHETQKIALGFYGLSRC